MFMFNWMVKVRCRNRGERVRAYYIILYEGRKEGKEMCEVS